MRQTTFTLHRGTAPLLISLPHDGTLLPQEIAERMTESAKGVPDTDWHVARLYAFARDLGASMLVPKYSRYVIDLNRSSDDVNLYPDQNTTGLCPVVQFLSEPIYLQNAEPTPQQISARVKTYWQPYHAALQGELARIRQEHGSVLLWEGHSIRGEVPFLFDGRLPDLNLGTADGHSCAPGLQAQLEAALGAQSRYDWVANARFKGGYITRHYGDPEHGINAVQLEISQRIYMDEQSFGYDEPKAALAQNIIRRLLENALQWL